MVLVCPQWDAIEAAFVRPGEPTPASTTLPLVLHLQNLYPVIGTGRDNRVFAVYGRRPLESPVPNPEAASVHGSLFRDLPDQPQPSNRVRLRLIDSDSATLTGDPYLYCGAMQRPGQAVANAVSQCLSRGYQFNTRAATPTTVVTVYLKGVTRGANMRSQPWWGIFVAVYCFEPPVEAPVLSEGFVIGRDLVQASCLLERPDDPQEPSLCRISALALENGRASFDGEPVFYRSTIC